MDSNTNNQQSHNYQQPNYGLLRFRSAPSSLFVNFDESNGIKGSSCEGLEKDKFSPRFMDYDHSKSNNNHVSSNEADAPTLFEEKSPSRTTAARGFSVGLPPHYPRQSSNSNPTRQTTSPPGPFNLNSHNGYCAIRNMGNYEMGNGISEDLNPASNNGLKGHNFSARLPSSLGLLPQISEIGSESPRDTKIAMRNNENHLFGSGFSFNSWNNSTNFLENFSGFKRGHDNTLKVFPGGQNGEHGNRVPLMSHHLSLPKTSSEIAAIEKFLQLQDSVPCKIRAKRGCATHPRSIAERVRRTRISERMRKLQELVPNMDKQTNTADMLDLAVEYIKDLQKQFKALSDSRANCKCSSIQKPLPNQLI